MTIDEINKQCKGTLMDLLGIRFTKYSETYAEAKMTVKPSLFQPGGSMHGGAIISLAESVAGAASFLNIDRDRYQVFGSVVNSQHLSPAREGTLTAVSSLVFRGKYKHIWDVEIKDDEGKLISISRVTNSVKPL